MKQKIARAFALHEGCYHTTVASENIVLNVGAKDPKSSSFRLFPLSDFDIRIEKMEGLNQFIEYFPDRITFFHKKDRKINLPISLDLYELIDFISNGFSPSLNDLRGRFIELEIFKNLLSNLRYREVILTENHEEFYKVKADENNHLIIEKMEIESWH